MSRSVQPAILWVASGAVLWVNANLLAQPRVAGIPTSLADLVGTGGGQSGLADHDGFGFCVAVDGDTAAVGALSENGPAGEAQGSVYVFVREGPAWKLQAHLRHDPADAGDGFGSSVALDGDTLAVGAFFQAGPGGIWQGAVYVFTRTGTTWTQQARLIADDGGADEQLGSSLSLDGDTLVAGAWGYIGEVGFRAGAAYVFVRDGDTWTQQARLVREGAAASDVFGHDVSVSGNTIAVGASGYDGPAGANQGLVQVFVRDGTNWSLQQQISPQESRRRQYFGKALALKGDTLAVGGYGDDGPAGRQQGAAWVFERTGQVWSQTARILPEDPQAGDQFGWSMDLEARWLLVGAPESGSLRPGSAYLFYRGADGWNQAAKLVARPAGSEERFGMDVGISAGTLVTGAWYGLAPDGTRPGNAYTFTLTPAADIDQDQDVDAADREAFLACVTGPTIPYTAESRPPGCTLLPDPAGYISADLDGDDDVDQEDLGLFHRCFDGANRPVALDCGG